MSTSQLPWPSAALEAAGWLGLRRLLARCLELHASGALPATMLIVGAPGLGREALALELAAALICRREGGAGCACGSCERVRRGVHPDLEILTVLADKKDISIEQARSVVDAVTQRPYEGLRRVYVVDSCQTPPLNSDAASALLKTLEEPPAQAVFLLLAGNPARVLPTIVSRAVQLRVPPPAREELAAVVAAAQACAPGRAEELLAAADGDAELILRSEGDDLVCALGDLGRLLPAALAGDGLAILRTASLPAPVARRHRSGKQRPSPPRRADSRRRGGGLAGRQRGPDRRREPARDPPSRHGERRGGRPRAGIDRELAVRSHEK